MAERALTRREIMRLGALSAAGALTGCASTGRRLGMLDGGPDRARTWRIAHLSDSHTQPERRAAEGTVACLRHLRELKPKVDMVVTGGDLIMDSFESDRARTKLQWDLYTGILRDECAVPIAHTLGNHDIWGWDKSKSGTTGSEPEYGKKWAMDVLGLDNPYYSFDRHGWHVVILDTVSSDGDSYLGRLGEEQFDWLRRELSSTAPTTPIILFSHIPIFAACVLSDFQKTAEAAREFNVPGSWMLIDSRRIRELFRSHPNVRLCVSGHIHQLDRVDYEGITYICDGAVSGAWWKGPNERCREGYGVLDLRPDGSWAHEYRAYGWNAERS